jgi:NADP-dependent 3-hydroxy acid dehydrogenase YdfG
MNVTDALPLTGRAAVVTGAAQLDQMLDVIGPLAAEDIADVVAFAVAQPRRVNLRQIIVLPTRQA